MTTRTALVQYRARMVLNQVGTMRQTVLRVAPIVVNTGDGASLPIAQSDVVGLPAALSVLQEQLTETQTLAQTNQLNIGLKADQVDLDTTAQQVETNRLALLNKADMTALATLTALVGTKADQSYVNDQIAALVGTDGQVLAAIQAIADELTNAEGVLEALDQTVANRVRFDVASQALTALQKSNARTNIGAEEAGEAARLIALITAASIGAATATQGAKADTALQSADVAPVALSGLFSSLAGQSGIFDVVFAGYTVGSNAVVTAADSLGTMLRKLQAQITALSIVARTGNYNDLTNKPSIDTLFTVLHKTTTPNRERFSSGNVSPFDLTTRGLFESNYIFPANTLSVGDAFRLEFLIVVPLTAAQSGNLGFQIFLNDAVFPFTTETLMSLSTLNTGQHFQGQFNFYVSAIGTAGKIYMDGFVMGRNAAFAFSTESSGTFNTVNAITLNASVRFTSSVSGSNKAYIKYARLVRINNP